MIIRPVTAQDLGQIKGLLAAGKVEIGQYVAREWDAERQLSEAILAHQYGEGESAGNIVLVAEVEQSLVGFIELQSMVGYQYTALSFAMSNILHRSDSLSVCHAQKLLTLDQGLLGQGAISLCIVHKKNPVATESQATPDFAVAKALLNAALAYVDQHPALFADGLFVALGGEPVFWSSVGEPLTQIAQPVVAHSHAELLPQSPIYESFLADALQAVLAPLERPSALKDWLVAQGFSWRKRLYPIDGGLIFERASR